MHKRESNLSKDAAKLVNAPLGNGTSSTTKSQAPASTPPEKFTYALPAFTVELRGQGWYIAKTVPNFAGEKCKWVGPFQSIETACLSIGRHLATEIADRHTRSVESHKIERGTPLYGIKVTTTVRTR